MRFTEKNIIHENGDYWVCQDNEYSQYVVYKNGITHSVSDSAYELNDDGLSIAVCRCNYLANRAKPKIKELLW